MTTKPRLTLLDRALIALEVLLSAGAWPAGIGLVLVPDGSGLGMSATEMLAGTPFTSFFVPGILLCLANGLWPLVAIVAAVRRAGWAHLGHVSVGCVLLGWIVVQVVLLGWPPHALQVAYFLVALLIGGLGLLAWRRSVSAAAASGP